jgi:hypothetical protein
MYVLAGLIVIELGAPKQDIYIYTYDITKDIY